MSLKVVYRDIQL